MMVSTDRKVQPLEPVLAGERNRKLMIDEIKEIEK